VAANPKHDWHLPLIQHLKEPPQGHNTKTRSNPDPKLSQLTVPMPQRFARQLQLHGQ
jgi:hypothetical protein